MNNTGSLSSGAMRAPSRAHFRTCARVIATQREAQVETTETSPATIAEAGAESSRYRTVWGDPVHFVSSHRARFVEIDSFGHMNTNHYVAYFTENRFIGHREVLKLDLDRLATYPIAPHIRKIEIEFIRPVRADELFVIDSFVAELRKSACLVYASMRSPAGLLHASCRLNVVSVDKQTSTQVPWCDDFISQFYLPA